MRQIPWSPRRKRAGRLGLFAVAVAGILLLVAMAPRLVHLLNTNPLSDVAAYYQAAQRLNAGEPLYDLTIDVNASEFYRYPPLLAILFRPFASLPYGVVATGWGILMVASLVGTVLVAGVRRRTTWLAVAALAFPITWSLALGQAQVAVTLLLALANPWSVALAGQIKVLPALVAIYWLARREWSPLGWFLLWSGALVVVQAILAPGAWLDFIEIFNLQQVGDITNLSPYAISPVLWGILAGLGLVLVVLSSRTRAGWAVAVAYSVLVTPRLIAYLLVALLGGLGRPAGQEKKAANRASRTSVSGAEER